MYSASLLKRWAHCGSTAWLIIKVRIDYITLVILGIMVDNILVLPVILMIRSLRLTKQLNQYLIIVYMLLNNTEYETFC